MISIGKKIDRVKQPLKCEKEVMSVTPVSLLVCSVCQVNIPVHFFICDIIWTTHKWCNSAKLN